MRAFLLMVGLPDMSGGQLAFVLALARAFAIMLGWLADSILGDGAFGIPGNALLLLAGAIAGAILWRRFGLAPGAASGIGQALSTALAAGTTAVVGLIGFSVSRRWI